MIRKEFRTHHVEVTFWWPVRDGLVGHANNIRSVELRGDIPGATWNEGIFFTNGSLQICLPFDKEYRFKLVVKDLNGVPTWENDPDSDGAENDGYGGVNSILSTAREDNQFLQSTYF